MAPPVHYLRPGEEADIHAWLAQKLQEERREVLLHLEDKHKRLLEQFLQRTIAGETNLAKVRQFEPAFKQVTPTQPAVQDALRQEEGPADVFDEVHGIEYEGEERQPANQDGEEDEDIEIGDDDARQQLKRNDTSMSMVDASDPFILTTRGQMFEWFFGFCIFANALVMAMNQQYLGIQRGYELSYRSYTSPKEDAWPAGEITFEVLEIFFTVVFTVEFIARWLIYRLKYLRDIWCYFDGMIVAFAWVTMFVHLSFNPTFVRLARVSKLLRLIRLIKGRAVFDCLKLLVAAINASFNILLWSLCVLLLIIVVGALFMVQMVELYLAAENNGDAVKLEEQRQVFKYFGTFWRSMLTMFEVTFANWVVSCRVLVENVDEKFAIFYLLYRCVVGLAVLMVVQAVFIQQTMKATQLDDEALAHQKAKSKSKLLHRLENMFKKLDNTGDGTLEFPEFQAALQDGEMVAMLEVFELEVSDIDVLWKLLDDGDGSISVEEFVAGVEHMKGNARAIDMMEIKKDIQRIKESLGGRGNKKSLGDQSN